MKKRIFAFDLGKTSIGYCVRENHDIKEANSFIIEKIIPMQHHCANEEELKKH